MTAQIILSPLDILILIVQIQCNFVYFVLNILLNEKKYYMGTQTNTHTHIHKHVRNGRLTHHNGLAEGLT